MKITFKQVDDQHVDILCGDKKIGKIFSPGGTGEAISNAIQVCGFEEAYDLWGCGVFSEKETTTHNYTEEQIAVQKLPPYLSDKTTYTKTIVKHKRDIQLLFKEYENVGLGYGHNVGDCYKCFDIQCSCEAKEPKDKRMTLKDSFNKEFKRRLDDKNYPNTKEEIDEVLLNKGRVD